MDRARVDMSAQSNKAWNDWAKDIASKEAGKLVLHAIEQILEVTKQNLEQRDARIAELEQRIVTLEGTKVTALHGRRSA